MKSVIRCDEVLSILVSDSGQKTCMIKKNVQQS